MTARAGSGGASLTPLGASALFVIAIGLIDGLLTDPGPWSAALQRPTWHPPAWAFGPVWAVIGIFTAFAVARGWERLASARDRQKFAVILAINASLNVAWSGLFFAARRPDLAAIDIAALWVSIAACAGFLLDKGARTAAALLMPYLVWVAIATALNVEIVRLNAPF